MTSVEIVPEGVTSPDLIKRFLIEAAAAYPAEVGRPDLNVWPGKLAAHATVFCVRRSDGSLAAALLAYLNDVVTHIGYIPFICALPECEKGVAYRLHEAYKKTAAELRMVKSRLEVVKANTHAYDFYFRQGYAVVEDRGDRNRYLMEALLTTPFLNG